MLSIESLRKIDPSLGNFTEDELEKIKKSLYDLGQLIFEDWNTNRYSSKNPVGLLTKVSSKNTI